MSFSLKSVILFTGCAFLTFQSGCSDSSPPRGYIHINPPGDVCTMVVDKETVWAGGKDGVFQIDLNTNKLLPPIKSAPEFSYVRTLLKDSQGRMWIGHIQGLGCIDKDKSFIDYSEKLPEKRVNYLFLDSQKRLWIGTWSGVTVFDGKNWKTYTEKDGLINDMVNVIQEDNNGRMWFGSYVAPRGGITVMDNGKFFTFKREQGLPHPNVTAILPTDKEVWIGTGLFHSGGAVAVKLTDNKFEIIKRLSKSDGLAGEKVRTIFRDHKGNLWFGSEYDGAVRWNGQSSFKIFSVNNGLCNPEVKCIVQDAFGNLWIGTRDGITKKISKTE